MFAGTFYLGLFVTIFSVLLTVFILTVTLLMLVLTYKPKRRLGTAAENLKRLSVHRKD
ncbi:hypothetical protein [Nesterenkonia natronophila]|uniref:hypothetical protein n=1 Tax=Nesterenkonia natronophila TaxID=2174932 RepID=UPI0013140F4C|nr:hypothetical protein [Nesterenkonia natronophila]